MSVLLPAASSGLVTALSALNGVAALLSCVDPKKWDSLGRPAAQSLGQLIHLAHGEVVAELGELVTLPDD